MCRVFIFLEAKIANKRSEDFFYIYHGSNIKKQTWHKKCPFLFYNGAIWEFVTYYKYDSKLF